MDIKTKYELTDLIYSSKNKSGYYTRETTWVKLFSDFYSELLTWSFPEEFKFTQKIYHYLNDDYELNIGKCIECGTRCTFVGLSYGYRKYCSKKCIMNSEEVRNKIKEVKLNRYGDENYCNKEKTLEIIKNKTPEEKQKIKEKRERTCLKKYGSRLASQSNIIKNKIRKTCKDKSKIIVEKRKQTCLDKYNDMNYNNRESAMETCLNTYGCEYIFQTEHFKILREQTLLEKYNVDEPLKSEEIKEKRIQTCLNKYNKEYTSQVKEFIDKSNITKKKNNSFNTSKIEKQIEQYLLDNNIIFVNQYTSEEYPFSCDFYFPEKDLYVEIQGSWTHGPHPFSNSDEDLKLLEKWKSKNTRYYDNAIDTWTRRDVKKRETAKQNNLNYLEIFSVDLEKCITELMLYINKYI